MQVALNEASEQAAREELEQVAASLARTPRLEQLIRYLARKYFAGELDQLTEYNIATEVFGRKKTEFIASEDAIARVETHRLRKRLTAFYEGPGKDHAVHISIPLGTYVPCFAEVSAPQSPRPSLLQEEAAVAGAGSSFGSESVVVPPPVFASEPPLPPTLAGREESPAAPHANKRWWWIAAAVALIGLLILGGRLLNSRREHPGGADQEAARAPLTETPGASAASVQAGSQTGEAVLSPAIRFVAGYAGPPQRDNAGEVWQEDAFYKGGWSHNPYQAFITRTSNPFLFRHGRMGDFSYDIPLAPGTYELHLYFMQSSDTEQAEDVENKEIFNVSLNGTLLLKNFDIVSDAMGRNTADERIFAGISPAPDGKLHLHFSTVLGTPSLSAVEIFPSRSHQQEPLRLVMQPTPLTDRKNLVWRPDDYFLGGRTLAHSLPSDDTDTLSSERYGHFSYALPVDTRDRYTVVLRFVELYFGAENDELHEDRRIFRVLCNGETLLDDFDILKEAGRFKVLEKQFHHIKPSAQGKINLQFEPVTNYATVSAIEVLSEAR